MNLPSFEVVIVCSGYAKYLAASLSFWANAQYDDFSVTVITSSEDEDTFDVVSALRNLDVRLLACRSVNFHKKGRMLKHAIARPFGQPKDFVFMTDADMIFSSDTLSRVAAAFVSWPDSVVSSVREEISSIDVDLFLSEHASRDGSWPWESLKRSIDRPSPFMGWMLAFPWRSAVGIDYQDDHDGYDTIDWKIHGQLVSSGLTPRLLRLDCPPLHVHHGKKGVNWKGVQVGRS